MDGPREAVDLVGQKEEAPADTDLDQMVGLKVDGNQEEVEEASQHGPHLLVAMVLHPDGQKAVEVEEQ